MTQGRSLRLLSLFSERLNGAVETFTGKGLSLLREGAPQSSLTGCLSASPAEAAQALQNQAPRGGPSQCGTISPGTHSVVVHRLGLAMSSIPMLCDPGSHLGSFLPFHLYSEQHFTFYIHHAFPWSLAVLCIL